MVKNLLVLELYPRSESLRYVEVILGGGYGIQVECMTWIYTVNNNTLS